MKVTPSRLISNLSMRYTERLIDAGIEPSVGSRGGSYDAFAETVIGLYKTEVIGGRARWGGLRRSNLQPWAGWTGLTIDAARLHRLRAAGRVRGAPLEQAAVV